MTVENPYASSANFIDDTIGVFLVRTSVAPVPALVWLFGSGLIGLLGFARCK